ncbi:endopeptidase [Variovorax sp. GT1P44]|uniref:Bbp19 family protein n=1 Tax=Variovorax sp. GT1P44 TaxID=3443742 RepID=UPI003F47D783
MSAVGPDQQATREEKAKASEREARDAIDELLWLMSDPRGRRFMWRQLSEFGVYRQSYVPGSFDQTAFNEGRRSVALMLTSQVMQHCPGRFTEMQKEAKSHERRNSSSTGSASSK